MKTEVICKVFGNGKLEREIRERRTVYKRADGSAYVKVMGNAKPAVRVNGIYTYETHFRSIKATPASEVLEHIKKATSITVMGDSGPMFTIKKP